LSQVNTHIGQRLAFLVDAILAPGTKAKKGRPGK